MDVYEGVVDYLKNFTVSDRDMTKYIIGTISNLDQPMTPSAKGERSMNLYMNQVNEDMIRKDKRRSTGCNAGGYPQRWHRYWKQSFRQTRSVLSEVKKRLKKQKTCSRQ